MPGLIRVPYLVLYRGVSSTNKTRHSGVILGISLCSGNGLKDVHRNVHLIELLTLFKKKWAKIRKDLVPLFSDASC